MPEWTTLSQLQPGAMFKTRDGVLAIKSEYHMPNAQSECVLLASGEYAHFPEKNDTEVQEVSAALIEAAPDLLAACKALMASIEGANAIYGLRVPQSAEIGYCAIAKAKGQTDATD